MPQGLRGGRQGHNGGGRYRCVLQASVLLCGHPIPLMQEHIDVDDPVSEKGDGSLAVTAIEQRETHKGTETRYAWISDVPRINRDNVRLLEGLRLLGGADPGFRVGQLRFVT